ncbi:MAG: hypothetical protein AB1324_06965 [Candidatus Micrarchaeota archaeon]
MKLVSYREFRPLDQSTPKMERLYGRLGITESFLRDAEYAGPHEMVWAILARNAVGRRFAQTLRRGLKGIEFTMEERAKSLERIADKIRRSDRMPGAEVEGALKILARLGLMESQYPIGSIRDMYGIRVIIPHGPASRDACYEVLERAMEAAGIGGPSEMLSLVDYLSYEQSRFGADESYLGRYESIHFSFARLSVPIEVQIRDSMMDWNAKNVVKRPGLD